MYISVKVFTLEQLASYLNKEVVINTKYEDYNVEFVEETMVPSGPGGSIKGYEVLIRTWPRMKREQNEEKDN